MMRIACSRRVVVATIAVGVAGAFVLSGATASAEPVPPPQPAPVPAPALPAPQSVAGAPSAVGNTLPGTAPSSSQLPVSSSLMPAQPAAPSPPAAQPALLPASSGTLRDYLQSKAVTLEPQQPQTLKALDITVPVPPRWTQVPDPNVPDAFAVIADRTGPSLYTSNAQVVVYKLVGDFDPAEAITHGYVDSLQQPAWRTTNASLADFDGFPSSHIEGTYRQNDMTLNTSRRHVIATSGNARYLVSLAVTTDVAVAVADAPATDAVVNGFRVRVPGAGSRVASPGQSPTAAR
ncbi:LpqN/LpqT family lipoprotein [Mycobacterium sp.]|uniref:LpqN/LpqT family lipoprotein n=1 Tax=Mycobacterium sp. TaxID=1785 RepID=UPI0031CEABEA